MGENRIDLSTGKVVVGVKGQIDRRAEEERDKREEVNHLVLLIITGRQLTFDRYSIFP